VNFLADVQRRNKILFFHILSYESSEVILDCIVCSPLVTILVFSHSGVPAGHVDVDTFILPQKNLVDPNLVNDVPVLPFSAIQHLCIHLQTPLRVVIAHL